MKKPYRYNEMSDQQCAKRNGDGIQCQRMLKQNLVYKKSQQGRLASRPGWRPGKLYCYEHYMQVQKPAGG